MKRVTVFGATGMLGQPVVKELVDAGFEVTAMVRSPEKARKILPESVNLVPGDLKNLADIEEVLKDTEGVYLNLAVAPESKQNDFQPEREGLDNVIAGAKKAKVKRIALCSSLVHRYQGMNNFNWWAFDIKHRAVEKVKASGIPYAIFYPSSFMENFDKGGFKQGNKMMLAGTQKFPMYYIAGSDYGKQVAKSFEILGDENREYSVQGLEAFIADEAVKIFVNNYQKEQLKISKTPILMLKVLGLFNQKMNYTAKIIDALNNYPEKFESETTWEELGKPQVTLAEYARNC
ncbi:MAG TPA: NAD(P)H-binding protein [Pyrinomonadaceae bacterium]|nr:NAD(P)H-binding protein [Pyrinomonadaceae bacterium]